MTEKKLSEMVKLPLGQNAEPYKCGSCHFFRRRSDVPDYMSDDAYKYNAGGYCTIELPPQYARVVRDAEGSPPNNINDTGSCDLWRWSGKVYVVSRIVQP